jgi:SAM-dependent methyltransferase
MTGKEAAVFRPLLHWRARRVGLHVETGERAARIPRSCSVTAAGALIVYAVLVIGRWHTSCFHGFVLFKNVSLISCLVGLGVGLGRGRSHRPALWMFLGLLALEGLISAVAARFPSVALCILRTPQDTLSAISTSAWGNLVLVALFTINAMAFVSMGQLGATHLSEVPGAVGLSWALAGGLAGLGVFCALCLGWTGPLIWLGLLVLGIAPFLVAEPWRVGSVAASLALLLVSFGLISNQEQLFFSPSQQIAVKLPAPQDHVPTVTIRTNQCFDEEIMDCSAPGVVTSERNAEAALYFDLPYRLRQGARDVLVLAAGAGNEVAAALRHDVRTVTAVDADPLPAFLGEIWHAERVYQDPRTRCVLGDARHFLRQTGRRFDLAVYGVPIVRCPAGVFAEVALEDRTCTLEGFRDALARLRDDGLLVVSCPSRDLRQCQRIFALLDSAYGRRLPRAFSVACDERIVIATGPGLDRVPWRLDAISERTRQLLSGLGDCHWPTDDWPFPYLNRPAIPRNYAIVLFFLAGITGCLAWWRSRVEKVTATAPPFIFFLGAGCTLIAARSIPELGVVFGNTWRLWALASCGFLTILVLASLWVARMGQVPHATSFALLAGALILGFMMTRLAGSGAQLALAKVAMPLALGLPLFFVGIIVSSEFGEGDAGAVLGRCLLGAALGGFLEYGSMCWGYSSLYPAGMGCFAVAFLLQTGTAAKSQTVGVEHSGDRAGIAGRRAA